MGAEETSQDSHPIEHVYAKRTIAYSFLAAALFIFLAGLYLGATLNTIYGIFLLIVALLYINNSLVEYDNDELRVKNILGITMKRASFHDDQITLREGRIVVNDTILRIGAGFLITEQVEKLHQHILKKNAKP